MEHIASYALIDHLSYSSISMFLTCGKSWQFRYVDHVQVPTSPELVFGSAAHGAVEAFLTEGGNIQDHWLKSWEEQIKKNPQISWDLDTPEGFCNDGIKILTHPDVLNGLKALKPATKDDHSVIEKRVELRVPGVPVPLTGFIDLITSDGIPGDFKTSKSRWSDEKAAAEIQPLVYLAALNQENPDLTPWTFRHYVIVKTKTPQWQVIEHHHNPAQLMWLFKMIQSVWKAIVAGSFTENPTGWKCSPNYCEYWNLCRGKYG